jgi:hypothetical protein
MLRDFDELATTIDLEFFSFLNPLLLHFLDICAHFVDASHPRYPRYPAIHTICASHPRHVYGITNTAGRGAQHHVQHPRTGTVSIQG